MRDRYAYLEFSIGSLARFDALARMFDALKAEKDRIVASRDSDAPDDEYNPAQEPNWIEFLDEPAREWFADTFDYDSEERKTYQKLWDLTPPDIRLSHPMFQLPGNWDFESMIDALFRGEYVFISLVRESGETGVLYYDPWAQPFGGSESMVAFIESFGHYVTFDSWHRGPHRRQTGAWDYALAKQLVAAGKGFTPT